MGYFEDFSDESTMKEVGTIQLKHESGLLINVPCYHGHKLPELGPDAKAFWNGKTHSLELYMVKVTASDVVPIVRCRHCGNMWRYTWDDVLPFVWDEELKKRLTVYK